jgi:hypothetical protein
MRAVVRDGGPDIAAVAVERLHRTGGTGHCVQVMAAFQTWCPPNRRLTRRVVRGVNIYGSSRPGYGRVNKYLGNDGLRGCGGHRPTICAWHRCSKVIMLCGRTLPARPRPAAWLPRFHVDNRLSYQPGARVDGLQQRLGRMQSILSVSAMHCWRDPRE